MRRIRRRTVPDILWNRGAGFVAALAGRRWRPPTHDRGACVSADYGSGHGHFHAPGPRAWRQRAISVVAWTHHQRRTDCVGRRYHHYEGSDADHPRDVAGLRDFRRERPCQHPAIHWRISGCLSDSGHSHGWTWESPISVAIAVADDGLAEGVKENFRPRTDYA